MGWRFGALSALVWGCSLVAGPHDFVVEERDAATDAPVADAPIPDAAADGGPMGCSTDDDCPLRPGVERATCRDGECEIGACVAGRGDCDGVTSNGCEVDLEADVEHCGRCANTCSFANAAAACVDGACEIERCLGGFGNCDGSRLTGCEADLRSPASCGTCEMSCAAPAILCDSSTSPAQCVEMCAAGATLCETRCVATATDPLNCGACDRACDTPTNAEATCAESTCGFSCVGTFRDCDEDASNGCERNTATSLDHCGACGTRCEGGNATWSCTSSACAVAGCDAGFDDCDGATGNGCETDLRTSSAHCGACGQACDGPCVDGICDPIVDIGGNGASLHRCLVRTSGRVECWGDNVAGQLGDGTVGTKAAPTTVLPPEGSAAPFFRARAVAAGQASTCAIAMDSTLWCWGRGLSGERGGGEATANMNFGVPQRVISSDAAFAARTFEQVASGTRHHCALDDEGGVWCWGENTAGQIGLAPGARVSEATRVSGTGAVAALGVLGEASCARTVDERVLCWGANPWGQLGDGTTSGRETPAPVRRAADEVLSGVVAFAAGNTHACALTRSQGLHCWGINTSREAGVPSGNEVTFATPIDLGGPVDEVHAGASVTCVRRAAGGYRCWGRRTEGQRGDGALAPNDATPTEPTGTAAATRLMLRGSSGYAFFADGRVLSWGNNANGALAQEPVAVRATPAPIVSPGGTGRLMNISSLAAGHRHACASSGGAAYCWGEAFYNGFSGGGQDSAVPRQVSSLPIGGVHSVRAGYFATGALVGDEASRVARGWGSNTTGIIGLGDTAGAPPSGGMNPREVQVAAPVADLAYTATHGCAIREGIVWCWGVNSNGQLGRGTMSAVELTPAPIVAAWNDARQLALGEAFSCVRRGNGEVWCWGAGGRLGTAAGTGSATPVRVQGLSRALAVAAGRTTVCAIEESVADPGRGQVACWGSAPIGDGTNTNASTPRSVQRAGGTPLSDAVDVAVGAAHACAVRNDGRVWCWGRNESSEVGDGTTEPRLNAVLLPELTSAVRVSSGDLRAHHTCAILADGTGACWGDCRQGACGTGEAIYRATPALAEGL